MSFPIGFHNKLNSIKKRIKEKFDDLKSKLNPKKNNRPQQQVQRQHDGPYYFLAFDLLNRNRIQRPTLFLTFCPENYLRLKPPIVPKLVSDRCLIDDNSKVPTQSSQQVYSSPRIEKLESLDDITTPGLKSSSYLRSDFTLIQPLDSSSDTLTIHMDETKIKERRRNNGRAVTRVIIVDADTLKKVTLKDCFSADLKSEKFILQRIDIIKPQGSNEGAVIFKVTVKRLNIIDYEENTSNLVNDNVVVESHPEIKLIEDLHIEGSAEINTDEQILTRTINSEVYQKSKCNEDIFPIAVNRANSASVNSEEDYLIKVHSSPKLENGNGLKQASKRISTLNNSLLINQSGNDEIILNDSELKKPRCSTCRRLGHYTKFCPLEINESDDIDQSKENMLTSKSQVEQDLDLEKLKNVRCSNCKKIGHVRKICPTKGAKKLKAKANGP